tara:strand:+ start:715 stop:828 length:114 start_codon:yes stop_codon:yes gene_type:complete
MSSTIKAAFKKKAFKFLPFLIFWENFFAAWFISLGRL